MFKLKRQNGIYYVQYKGFLIASPDLRSAIRHLTLMQGILLGNVETVTRVMRQSPRIGGMTLNVIARAMHK